MRLLIFTQKVDQADSNLGFFLGWLEKFSQKLDKVLVVCLAEGEHTLPGNVHVFNLGKNLGYSKLRQFLRLQKFLWHSLDQVDGVFYHMCPIFVLASFPLPQIFRKRQVLWFTHKSVNFKLWLSSKLVHKIITASKKSCRLKNRKKIEVVGHGINLEQFKPGSCRPSHCHLPQCHPEGAPPSGGATEGSPKQGDSSAHPPTAGLLQNDRFQILTAGRISPSKDLKTLIEALSMLPLPYPSSPSHPPSPFGLRRARREGEERGGGGFILEIIGEPVDQLGQEYFAEVKQLVKQKNLENIVHFKGAVPYSEMPQQYHQADLFVNLSKTGSIDKAVLEAMATGTLVLTSNEAFKGLLPKEYLFEQDNAQELAEKLLFLKNNRAPIHTQTLRQLVKNFHNLTTLIDKIISLY